MRELNETELNVVSGGAAEGDAPNPLAIFPVIGIFATIWFAFVGILAVAAPLSLLTGEK